MDPKSLTMRFMSIFTLPEIALRINEILNSPDPKNAQLEEVILHDPALTANILKIANSAYFGFPSKIETVSRAITLIGLKELRNLVIAISVITRFKGIPAELVDMDIFWYHSITRGILAKILAKRFKLENHERFFITGLLSSIGKLIFFTQCPMQSKEVLSFKNQGEDAMVAAEQEIFGFNYADLGAELLKQWRLPPSIWEIIARQRDPLSAPEYKKATCILHVAIKIVNSIEPCAKYDFDFKDWDPNINLEILEYLDITPNAIHYSIDEALRQSLDIINILQPDNTMAA